MAAMEYFWLRFHAVSGAYSPLISLFGDVADVDTARCTEILSNRICYLKSLHHSVQSPVLVNLKNVELSTRPVLHSEIHIICNCLIV